MANPIGGLNSLNPALPGALSPSPGAAPAAGAGALSFQDLLLRSVEQVQELQGDAEASITGNLIGDDLTMAETFSSVKKADLALRMMLQVRNKLLDAYEEVKQIRM